MKEKHNNNPMVSIILPMYNCEEYLDELFEMLSEQSFSDFEAICVNDGSVDGTEQKLKVLCPRDDRFSYITKENGGAGSARNAGLDVARGKYVMFLDADDLYSPDLLKEMVDAAEEYQGDVTICMFKLYDILLGNDMKDRGLYGQFLKAENDKNVVALSPEDIPNLFQCTNPSPLNKMYRSSFLKKNGLRYPSCAVAEDLAFTFTALSLAESIVCVRKNLIKLRPGNNAGSLTLNRSRHINDAIDALKLLYQWLKEHNKAEEYMDTYLRAGANAIRYETNFCYNEEYLNKALHLLLNEEPWTNITIRQLTQLMKPDSVSEEKNLKKLEQELSDSEDDLMLSNKAWSTKNRMNSMRYMEKVLEEKRPAISVIIPVYNSYEFLSDLLSDIKNQTFEDFEAIFVDDESTDGSREFLIDECKKDSRFTCIPVKHAGAGTARNTGLDAASGIYVMFFDADDRYNCDLLKEMHSAMLRHDVDEVFCLYDEYNYIENTHKENIGVFLPEFPDDTPLKTSEIDNMLCCTSWRPTNALFKREIIDRYNLRFSATQVSNDVFFIYAYASATESMVCIHKHLLTVRRYVNSTSLTSGRWKHTEDVVTSLRELYTWLEKNGFDKQYKDTFMQICRYSIGYNTSFVYNQKYIDELTKFICCEKPFKEINDSTLYKICWSDFDEKKLKKQLSVKKNEDTKTAVLEAQQISNRLLSVQAIEQLAQEKYGRVLNPNTSAGKISALQKKVTDLELNIKKIRNSKTFKIGSFFTQGPRLVRRFAKKLKKRFKKKSLRCR